MKFTSTTALRAAILCSAAIALSACAYGPRHEHGAYYSDDPCETDHSYCGYSQYEGGIYFGGTWYDGRYRYRDEGGNREYWVHGGWHRADQTRSSHDANRDMHDQMHDHDRDQKAMEHAHDRDKQMKEHEHDSDQAPSGNDHSDANSDQHDSDHAAAKAEHDKQHAEDKAKHDKEHDSDKNDHDSDTH